MLKYYLEELWLQRDEITACHFYVWILAGNSREIKVLILVLQNQYKRLRAQYQYSSKVIREKLHINDLAFKILDYRNK
jgi:hypothetical protein